MDRRLYTLLLLGRNTVKNRLMSTIALLLVIATLGVVWAQDGATRTFVDDTGRTVEVPDRSQRIVALHSGNGPAQLFSLDAPVVGIGTRGGLFGDLTISTGLSSSDLEQRVAPIGDWNEPDIEKIAALRPDLIVGYAIDNAPARPYADPEFIARLERIAPVVFLHTFAPIPEVMARFGELLGVDAQVAEQLAAFEARVADIRARMAVAPEELTVSSVYLYADHIRVNGPHLSAMEQALDAFGVVWSAVTPEAGGQDQISIERMNELDADLITWYTFDGELTPTVRQLFEQLAAHRAGQTYALDSSYGGHTFLALQNALDFLEPILTNPDLNPNVVDESEWE
jgi:iron complex transport system substrate-binding protein